jgi:hypothetical protein
LGLAVCFFGELWCCGVEPDDVDAIVRRHAWRTRRGARPDVDVDSILWSDR